MAGSQNISDRLKRWRQRNSLTQRKAAERLSISERTLQQWEQGRQSPRGLALHGLLAATEPPGD
ncbi:MAG: helix-turn-helix transcriptional regulator [Chthoniobacteraceae bacterium]